MNILQFLKSLISRDLTMFVSFNCMFLCPESNILLTIIENCGVIRVNKGHKIKEDKTIHFSYIFRLGPSQSIIN